MEILPGNATKYPHYPTPLVGLPRVFSFWALRDFPSHVWSVAPIERFRPSGMQADTCGQHRISVLNDKPIVRGVSYE